MKSEPTLQEAFNIAAEHLMTTKRPSGRTMPEGGFWCSYSGSGCAMMPFLRDADHSLEYYDERGTICEIVDSDIQVPKYIEDHLEFYSKLQEAHDDPAVQSGSWYEGWKEQDAPNHSACATREDILIAERDHFEEQVIELKKTLETIQYYFDSPVSDNAELLEKLEEIFYDRNLYTGSKLNSELFYDKEKY